MLHSIIKFIFLWKQFALTKILSSYYSANKFTFLARENISEYPHTQISLNLIPILIVRNNRCKVNTEKTSLRVLLAKLFYPFTKEQPIEVQQYNGKHVKMWATEI